MFDDVRRHLASPQRLTPSLKFKPKSNLTFLRAPFVKVDINDIRNMQSVEFFPVRFLFIEVGLRLATFLIDESVVTLFH